MFVELFVSDKVMEQLNELLVKLEIGLETFSKILELLEKETLGSETLLLKTFFPQ